MPKKQRKNLQKTKVMPLIHNNAAGIDVGATEIFVAVPDDRDSNSVRCFETFTQGLHDAAKWLRKCNIDSVAMESTGVYWIPVFQILESYGLDVILVNARHVKNVPGRKTDVQDCQWLQYLHSVGLLRGSYRPTKEVCAVRSLLRHRDNIIKMSACHVQHMQKALNQMNLHLHHVISDITGVTGLKIIDSILAGERNPKKLSALKDHRIKASKDKIAKSLTGDYLPEHIFTLRQALQAYRHYRRMISDCDREIEKHLEKFDSQIDQDKFANRAKPRKKPQRNEPNFDLHGHLYRIIGTDLTRIDGIKVICKKYFTIKLVE